MRIEIPTQPLPEHVAEACAAGRILAIAALAPGHDPTPGDAYVPPWTFCADLPEAPPEPLDIDVRIAELEADVAPLRARLAEREDPAEVAPG